jgi:predicted PurR-regulated permease PerM
MVAAMHHTQVSAGLVAKVVLVAAAVVGALYFVYLTREILGLFLVAVFFAVAITPPVNWLHHHKVPRWLAILLVYLAFAGAIFGIGLLVVPPLVNGVEDLSNDLPGYVEDLRDNETFREYDDRYEITEQLTQQAEELPSKLGDAAGTLRDVTVGVFSRFVQLFSILVLAFFLVKDGDRILGFAYRNVPAEREKRLRTMADDVSEAIVGYVFGNFLISVLAGFVTYVTLTILDVPFAVPLAVLFGFADLVPLVGATVGGILVGIVVAFTNFPLGLIIWAVVLILYQQIENNMIQPYVYGRTVELHPLIILIAILIGGSLLGILGALMAIPAAAAVMAVVRDWWRFRQSGPPLGAADAGRPGAAPGTAGTPAEAGEPA